MPADFEARRLSLSVASSLVHQLAVSCLAARAIHPSIRPSTNPSLLSDSLALVGFPLLFSFLSYFAVSFSLFSLGIQDGGE